MKKRFCLLLLLPLFLLSCDKCDKDDCGCLSNADNGFAFRPETVLHKGGFTRAELDTIVIEKYTKALTRLLLTDTLELDTLRSTISENPLNTHFRYVRKWDKWPFDAIYINQSNPRKNNENYGDYDYKIYIGEQKYYVISNINVAGHQDDVECCNCYINERKTLQVNSASLDFSGPGSSNAIITVGK